jgi:hypothetical protein
MIICQFYNYNYFQLRCNYVSICKLMFLDCFGAANRSILVQNNAIL